MDREFVLAVLTLAGVGPLLLAAGIGRPRECPAVSAAARERRCWRELWSPLVPAGVLVAAIGGWAVAEPAEAEKLPIVVLAMSLPFAAIWIRAGVRSVRALLLARHVPTAAAVGLVRPRVIIALKFAQNLDQSVLDAVHAHEKGHVHHRDPLRFWLAQTVADLQWPAGGGHRRLQRWRWALEVVRDEEARRSGVEGADLAAGVIAALRFNAGSVLPACPSIMGDPAEIGDRIRLLLEPLAEPMPEPRRRVGVPPFVIATACVALVLGERFGEAIVRALVQIL